MPIAYELIDTHTGDVIRIYKTRKPATRRADKLDLQHGAIRYRVRAIWPEDECGCGDSMCETCNLVAV